MPNDSNKLVGNQGELLVSDWLTAHGYRILFRNYLCRGGELDIVAVKGSALSFVEVKTRLSQYFDLSEVITNSKRKRMIFAAKRYLFENARFSDYTHQFDVALVEKNGADFKIRYLPNAFHGTEF